MMIIGKGEFLFQVVEGWGKHFYSPFVEVAGVGTDQGDQVYVFIRGIDPLLVFNSQGDLLRCWGREHFTRPHGILIAPDKTLYCVDDGNHTLQQFTPEGRLLMTLGTKNKPSDTGCIDKDYRTIKQAAGPFNSPTDIAMDQQGNIYVSDGYGNSRVHKFSKEGELLRSWGEPGREPGQFNLPHGIAIDRGIVYVADRENSRIQLFDLEGRFLEQWSANRPTDVCIYDRNLYVTELGYRTGSRLISTSPRDGVMHGRVSVLSLNGEVLSHLGGEEGCAPGSFFAPHTVAVDTKGDLYVGEVAITSVGSTGTVPANCHTLQKLKRIC